MYILSKIIFIINFIIVSGQSLAMEPHSDSVKAPYSEFEMIPTFLCEKNDPKHRWAYTLLKALEEFGFKGEPKNFDDWEKFDHWVQDKYELNTVKYLSDQERNELKISFLGNAIYQAGKHLKEDGPLMYVMDKYGEFYTHKKFSALEHKIGMNHSSFFSGGLVSSAGFLYVKSGEIEAIDNHSGHYHPTDLHVQNALCGLLLKGVDLSAVMLKKRMEGTYKASLWLNEKQCYQHSL